MSTKYREICLANIVERSNETVLLNEFSKLAQQNRTTLDRAEQAPLYMYKPANFGVRYDTAPVTRPELFEVPFCRKVAVVRLSVLKRHFF